MVEFLSPLGWLVALAALLPLGAALLRGRRDAHVRTLLGLPAPRFRARAAGAATAAVAIGLLAAATAQPAIPTGSTERTRTDAQVYFVLDVSRSMLARSRGGPTRYERALAAAQELRAALADVPAGIASLTDRPLPRLFPTASRGIFTAVLHRSLGIQRPPAEAGKNVQGLSTTFDPLVQVGTAGYFGQRVKHRLVILLTDGESDLYSPEEVARQLHETRVGLLVLRFWHAGERVYTKGRPEVYRPNAASLRPLETLAATGPGVFDESRRGAAVRAAKKWLGTGPTATTGRAGHLELAPYAAAAAVVPLAFLLWRRDP